MACVRIADGDRLALVFVDDRLPCWDGDGGEAAWPEVLVGPGQEEGS